MSGADLFERAAGSAFDVNRPLMFFFFLGYFLPVNAITATPASLAARFNSMSSVAKGMLSRNANSR